jgi:uncharacterized membrane protein
MDKKRIWELDTLRGVFVLCMISVHIVYDLVDLYGIIHWDYPPVYTFFRGRIGMMFLLISGICATLGKRSVRRGIQVLGCGMLVTAVTVAIYLLGLADRIIIIYFGILHCLGICMLLWPLFKKCATWLLGVFGGIFALIGLCFYNVAPVDFPWLIPLGLLYPEFQSADYFPLLPHLGFFLLGAVLGRTLYAKKESLLPNVNANNPVIRFLSGCGRYSLFIYMIHQPIIAALCGGLAWLLD